VSAEAASARVAPLSLIDFEELDANLPGQDVLPAPWTQLSHLNRYLDVLPNKHSRVPLGQASGCPGYINANYVRGFDGNENAYIATQGPMPETAAHFWQMVWEQGSTVIVMLTGLSEKGRPKCHRYWPPVESEARYGSITVTVTFSEQVGSHIRSVLRIHNSAVGSSGGGETDAAEARTVYHFWYALWPDHGTPEDVAGVLGLLTDVRLHGRSGGAASGNPGEAPPWIVHCSAGIGRTGTFIGIDMGAHQLRVDGQTHVLKLIQGMREDRGGMVQTDVQARFIHAALTTIAIDPTALPEL